MRLTDVETVLLAGATGGTGWELLDLLAPRVETVRALTRSRENVANLEMAGADTVFVDDLLAPSDLEPAVEGADVVISAVGTAPRAVFSGPPYVDGEGAQTLLEAAVQANVDAFVMESALGVGDEPASALGTLFNLMINPIQTAKSETEAAIRESPLRHTIFRPGILTNRPQTNAVTVAEPGAKLWGLISRRDVARLMAAAPVTGAAANRTFELTATPRLADRGLNIEWELPNKCD